MDCESENEKIRDSVREGYTSIAKGGSGCYCGSSEPDKLAEGIGYTTEELEALPEEANMGLSCGNPTAIANLQPGQVVIVLAKLDNLKIETTDLSELNIATVDIGQPVSVYVEALDKKFQGTVTAISPISDTIGGDVVFKVTVQLEEQPLDLLWGMSADVEIQTEQ